MWDEQASIYLRRLAVRVDKILKLMETTAFVRTGKFYTLSGTIDGAPTAGEVLLSDLTTVPGGAAP